MDPSIYTDLHPGNVGFTSRLQLKLFDFGMAILVKKKRFRLKTYQMTNIRTYYLHTTGC